MGFLLGRGTLSYSQRSACPDLLNSYKKKPDKNSRRKVVSWENACYNFYQITERIEDNESKMDYTGGDGTG